MSRLGTGNRESDYGPLVVGDRVVIQAPGGRRGSARANADALEGTVIKAGPKNVTVELDCGRSVIASRPLAIKNNSGLKSALASRPTARRTTAAQARARFEAGATVLVSASGLEEITVTPSSVTHSRVTTTWEELTGLVDMWANRHPGQAFYVLEERAA